MKQNTPNLETNRLKLRKFCENDIAAIYEIFSDKTVNTFLPWFALKSYDEAKSFYIETYQKAYAKPNGYYYAICLKSDNIPIGYVSVSMKESHDLGYGLRKEFWHQGIVTEAAQAVIEQIRKDGLPFITATHDIDNTASGNVMKRLGMQYQYSYEEQWMPKNRLVTFRMYQLNFDESAQPYMEYWNQASVKYREENVSMPGL